MRNILGRVHSLGSLDLFVPLELILRGFVKVLARRIHSKGLIVIEVLIGCQESLDLSSFLGVWICLCVWDC